ncbi:MAG: DNA methyltransferase [Nitrosomonadales bacterium]
MPELGLKEVSFASVPDMLAKMDNVTALKLVHEVLPSINILDPAVGSGAFLVAALKVLINIYSAVVGRAELSASDALQFWLKTIQKEHPSVAYYIKRRIVTDNLYGVDIMQEATEIAKLRLFLTMVSSVRKVEELEPLPNIDFNILPGNSLVGLMRVNEHEFERKQDDLFKTPFRKLLEDKNRKLETYRHTADLMGRDVNLRNLRDDIDQSMKEASSTLNELLRDQFEALGVKYEQAAWDAANNTLGKPKKIKVARAHIDEQTPFHWGYMFDQIMQKQGGFDIILTNPPWEVFKPQAKEFFAEHSELVTKNKMTIKEFEKEQEKLLANKEIRAAWLDYESRFPHISAYFRAAPEFSFQSAVVNGKKTGSDLNLYKLFVERCFGLLRPGGHCGIVIPSGIYTDLGAKGLRDLLFNHSHIEGLFCFENRKTIFEGVDSRFKFVVLTFEKTAKPRLQQEGERNVSAPPDDLLAPNGGTTSFPAAFMRHDVAELDRFPNEGALWLDVELIRHLSPDSHSVMEFKSDLDVQIAKKMLRFPLLGEEIEGAWNLRLSNEFHMTNDSKLFNTEPGAGRLPLYEGKMMWQFEHKLAGPRYWIDEQAGRKGLLGKKTDNADILDYQLYRFGMRRVAANTNERTLVATVLPKNCFAAESFHLAIKGTVSEAEQLFLTSVVNSFVLDAYARNKVTTNINQYIVFQFPIPRLTTTDPRFTPIVTRAARLICTTPEFDDLAKEIGIGSHKKGVADALERARLRAELDGLIAHLYGLTEAEFAHILTTFPLVPDPVKLAALNAYRDVERGLVK